MAQKTIAFFALCLARHQVQLIDNTIGYVNSGISGTLF